MRVRLFLAASGAAVAFALAAPAGAIDVPGDGFTVTGEFGVGGTITITDDDPTPCDGENGSASLSRPIGGSNFIPVVSNVAPLVEGQVWSVTLPIPATDKGNPATALVPGMTLVLDVGGVCNDLGDQFGFQREDLELTLGEPVTAPATTTTTTDPGATTTTVTAGAVPTTATASTTPTTAGAAAAAELPRTGGGSGVPIGIAFVLVGAAVVVAAGRRPARRGA
ncbi:MAG TPA: hypothetical protein VFX21_06500 [Acidimicrobiia bacterium]|nr:hypothetical protein [Acidimicrobiia bacterium]